MGRTRAIKEILAHPQKESKLAAVRFMVRWIALGYIAGLFVASIGTFELLFDNKHLVGDYVYFPLFMWGTLGWTYLIFKPKSEHVKHAVSPIVFTCVIRLMEALLYEDTSGGPFGRFNATTIISIWMIMIWSLVTVVILTEFHVQVKGSRLSG